MLRILTYHRIAEASRDPHLNPRLISATPEVFAAQMRHLAEQYQVVRLTEVLEAAVAGKPLPKRAVLITFDDAYRDFLEVAWPILQSHGLPSVLFVPTAYPDHPERAFWWDRLYRAFADPACTRLESPELGTLSLLTRLERLSALRSASNRCKELEHDKAMDLVDELCDQLGHESQPYRSVLDWNELRCLSREDVTLCAHTTWHPLLTRVPHERVWFEVMHSQRDVRREVGEVLPVFSYPDGAHDDDVVETLRQQGFLVAVTQLDGHNDLRRTDPLRLQRTNITPRTTLPFFKLRLQNWFTHIDRWRHGQGRRFPARGTAS
ncbi:MAG: polysaccharide deacetylase family protein [Candidatus Latescibacterota bacterium]|nr:MAG: polysaccharide deacetylase family protein [Candidatus Latescibacterota bacterium]